MKNYLKKNGVRVLILVLAAALLLGLGVVLKGGTALTAGASGLLTAPLQNLTRSAARLFDGIYAKIYEHDALVAENESLRAQLADAEQSARDGVDAAEENERLRELMKLHNEHGDYVFESARIVRWSDSVWSYSFTISKGRSSGIEVGDPVITEDQVVVGQVTAVSESEATVSTVIDVNMSLGAYVGTTGTAGIVLGDYALMKSRQAKLTYMDDGAQIYVGDEVQTSGAGGAFPAGLTVGRIVAVQTEAGGQITFGLIEPACAFSSLVQVFIIKDYQRAE